MIGVGVVAKDPRGRILLGRRVKADEPPSWCLPGGAVESGESFEQAALRELGEETGLHATGAELLGTFLADAAEVELTAGVLVHGFAGNPRITEPHIFTAWQWFTPEEIPKDLFPATKMVLQLLSGHPVEGAIAAYSAARTGS